MKTPNLYTVYIEIRLVRGDRTDFGFELRESLDSVGSWRILNPL